MANPVTGLRLSDEARGTIEALVEHLSAKIDAALPEYLKGRPQSRVTMTEVVEMALAHLAASEGLEGPFAAPPAPPE
jgi:hypothetical protein